MNTAKCPCGGTWTRHGKTDSKLKGQGMKYRCNTCGKNITVRNGEVAKRKEPFRPIQFNWKAMR